MKEFNRSIDKLDSDEDEELQQLLQDKQQQQDEQQDRKPSLEDRLQQKMDEAKFELSGHTDEDDEIDWPSQPVATTVATAAGAAAATSSGDPSTLEDRVEEKMDAYRSLRPRSSGELIDWRLQADKRDSIKGTRMNQVTSSH